jgi:hypothetical protein
MINLRGHFGEKHVTPKHTRDYTRVHKGLPYISKHFHS